MVGRTGDASPVSPAVATPLGPPTTGAYVRPFSLSVVMYENVFGNLTVSVNSAVNVVIYCLMGRQFRAILLRAIGCAAGERNGTRARRNPVDAGRRAVPLHHAPTGPPPDHAVPERESSTFHHSAAESAMCRVDVAVDVHEMTLKTELDTRGVRCVSTCGGDTVDDSSDK